MLQLVDAKDFELSLLSTILKCLSLYIMQTNKKYSIDNFYKEDSYLNILDREEPYKSNEFFKTLVSEPFELNVSIKKIRTFEDIKYHLTKKLQKRVRDNVFYYKWIKDMSKICNLYYDIIKQDKLNFSLKTSRGCKRYHIDNVPTRLLVTYYGKGTEWLPRDACNYSAYYNGECNENIIKVKNKSKFIKPWSIAIFKGQKFKGGTEAILHRTPNEALNKKSLLMCLDSEAFS